MGMSITSMPRLPVYSTADATSLAALTSMQTGDLCLQLDTFVWYYYTGSAWTGLSSGNLALIQHQTPSAASAVTFSSISGYKWLLLVYNLTSDAAGNKDLNLTCNNAGGTAYDHRNRLAASVSNTTGAAQIKLANACLNSANSVGGHIIFAVEKAGSGNHHGIQVSHMGEGGGTVADGSCFYSDANNITRLDIAPSSSTVSGYDTLYGLGVA